MSSLRIDEKMAHHAKILRAGNAAVGAWVRMGAHSLQYRKKGFLTKEEARDIAKRSELTRLVDARLLEVVEDGYQIHDFLEWNREDGEEDEPGTRMPKPGSSTSRVRAFREKMKRDETLNETLCNADETDDETPDETVPSVSSVSSRALSLSDLDLRSPSFSSDLSLPLGSSLEDASKPEWGGPADIPITDLVVAACEQAGAPVPTRDDVQLFLNNHRSKKIVLPDWGRGLVAWMLREKRFQARNPPGSGKHRIVQGYDPDAPWMVAARKAGA